MSQLRPHKPGMNATQRSKLSAFRGDEVSLISHAEEKPIIAYKLFDDIKPADIKQGHCGNCYFLSAVSSIAEYPNRICRIFKQKEANKQGIYALNFMVDGYPVEVVVDDLFPYDPHKEKWAFARTT